MNGFAERGLDEDAFGDKGALSAVKAFDAFPKTKPSYTEKTSTGGVWTIVLVVASTILAWTELGRWWKGTTTHNFAVEQGVGHDLQINLDVVVAMKCEDLHINVQDASGDRILAGQALKKDPTMWEHWGSNRKAHTLGASKKDRLDLSGYPGFAEYREEDVHDHLGAARGSKKFSKTPRVPKSRMVDSCRVYGSMHGNKVQGDFHITARGHGYMEFGQHLDHKSKFDHIIHERQVLTTMQLSTSATTSTNYRLDLSTHLLSIHLTTPLPPPRDTSTSSNTIFQWCRLSIPQMSSNCQRLTNIMSPHLPARMA